MKYYCRLLIPKEFASFISDVLLVIILLSATFSSYSQLKDTTSNDSLIQEIQKFVDKRYVNGSVLIAQHDSIIYEYYRGYIDFRRHKRVNATTPFHIASTSKTFTAMFMLKLHQENKINIYDPVSKYIDGFPYPNIQIFHLLCHRSGLKYYGYFLSRRYKKYYTNKGIVKYINKYKPKLAFATNSRFKYCNTNYVILAYLIEKITGKSYEQALKETFFEPYEMNNTFVFDQISEYKKTTPSYTRRRYRYNLTSFDLIYGDKNIYSTAQDLYKWHKALKDTSLFKPETLLLAYELFSPIRSKSQVKGYGLGWRIFYTPDYYKVVYHNGWWHGNKTFFLRVPDKDLVIIAMNNVSSSAVYNFKQLLPLLIPSSTTLPTIEDSFDFYSMMTLPLD